MLDTIKNFIQKLASVRDPALDQLNRARELVEKALSDAPSEGNIQYSLDENGHLLNGAEYARLQSNWNAQETGVEFENRKNGGHPVTILSLVLTLFVYA